MVAPTGLLQNWLNFRDMLVLVFPVGNGKWHVKSEVLLVNNKFILKTLVVGSEIFIFFIILFYFIFNVMGGLF